ncbi:von Willebrand factor C domain-containing protein 2-like [Saccostrea echinata]|uniref:von Willebrand factor C domain-containing protein 2-like n=1 Tax=Saccostrea echinata TaxID=191078 RepID=UPI002A80DEEC|nr:von Willebrand factor C domain-containing protein 2-like [Saccostrea echinata]
MISAAVLVFAITYVQGELLPLELTTTAGCYYQGSYYPIGSFKPTPCEYCQCTTSGQAMCAIADCFITPCVDAIHEKDKCCPTCPNGHNCKAPDGHIIKAGDTYHMNRYTTCHCDGHQFGSNLAVCAHIAIDPHHFPHSG